MQEVTGSIPVSSTNTPANQKSLKATSLIGGAHASLKFFCMRDAPHPVDVEREHQRDLDTSANA
jgi:hypothetical protein